jgi:uncharacterized protein
MIARLYLIALGAGLLFGAGLAVSGMNDTARVLGFLDLAAIGSGTWDPSLAIVMVASLIVTVPAFQYARRRARPIAAAQFQAPAKTAIDRRLVLGALIFGIGWGLVGYCPGAVLGALAFGAPATVVALLSILAGMLLENWVSRRLAQRDQIDRQNSGSFQREKA